MLPTMNEPVPPRPAMPRWLVGVFSVGAVIVAVPFAPWVVLAAWLGRYAKRVQLRILRFMPKRPELAATLSILAMVIIVVPIAALSASVIIDAIALVQQLLASDRGKTVLEQLAGGAPAPGGNATQHSFTSIEGIADLVRNQGERAWAIMTRVAGATAHFVIGVLILVTGMFGMIVEGEKWKAWMYKVAPFQPRTLDRLSDAFIETGRGLAYGIIGAGLIQAAVATIAFIVLQVPSALALGMLTLLFSVIPAVGTAIVWVPVAAGLAMTGRTGAAIILAVIGVAVIGSVDNLARPFLARRGKLALPGYVLLIAMFGGVELIGGWGLMLGPLVVRLAKEAIAIRAEPGDVITL